MIYQMIQSSAAILFNLITAGAVPFPAPGGEGALPGSRRKTINVGADGFTYSMNEKQNLELGADAASLATGSTQPGEFGSPEAANSAPAVSPDRPNFGAPWRVLIRPCSDP